MCSFAKVSAVVRHSVAGVGSEDERGKPGIGQRSDPQPRGAAASVAASLPGGRGEFGNHHPGCAYWSGSGLAVFDGKAVVRLGAELAWTAVAALVRGAFIGGFHL
jgi:hypothetical protein